LTILDDEFKSMFPEFKSDDELFFVLGDGAAEDVVKVLREKKVACVPILDPVKKVDNEPRVQGLADVTDIAAFVFGLDKDSVRGSSMIARDVRLYSTGSIPEAPG